MHQRSEAKICLQLGHSGPKGSTQLGWEEIDAPLRDGNWELIAPSPIPWSPYNQVPREMTRDDMDAVRDAFVTATQYGARAGFDMLELHAAHGYLLSSFISPLTNRRDDEYGGSLREPPALSAGGVPRHARGVAGAQADVGAHLGDRLGGGRHRRRRRGGDRARVQARRAWT